MNYRETMEHDVFGVANGNGDTETQYRIDICHKLLRAFLTAVDNFNQQLVSSVRIRPLSVDEMPICCRNEYTEFALKDLSPNELEALTQMASAATLSSYVYLDGRRIDVGRLLPVWLMCSQRIGGRRDYREVFALTEHMALDVAEYVMLGAKDKELVTVINISDMLPTVSHDDVVY